MTNVWKLFRLQLDNKYDFLKTHNIKKMLFQLFVYLLTIGALTVGFSFVCYKIFILGFRIDENLMGLLLLATQCISVVFAISSIISNIYTSKNNEFLMSLPTTPNNVFFSKLMLVYIDDVVANTMITLPLLLAMGYIGDKSAVFYLASVLYMVLLPAFSMGIASFLSIPIMFVVRFLQRHTLVSILLILVAVAVGVFGYSRFIGLFSQSFDIVDKQIETVRTINEQIALIGSRIPFFLQLGIAMFSFKAWYWLAVLVGICAVLLALTLLLVRPFFFKMAMKSLENTGVVVGRAGRFHASSPLGSLLLKEVLCVFRSPSYVFQYFLFTLLMPFIVYCYDQLLTTIAVNQAGTIMIAGSHVMIVAIMTMLSNVVSASAISREGACFYLSKVAPVNPYLQIGAKVLFNAIFTFSALIVTAIVSLFYLTAWQVILGTIAIAFASIGHIAYSVEIDVKNPVLDWYSDDEVTKVGANTPKSIVFGLLLAVGMGMVVILMATNPNIYLSWVLLLVFGVLFAIFRIYRLILRINLQFGRIEF